MRRLVVLVGSIVLLVGCGISKSPSNSSSATSTTAGNSTPTKSCFTGTPGLNFSLDLIDCSKPHAAELITATATSKITYGDLCADSLDVPRIPVFDVTTNTNAADEINYWFTGDDIRRELKVDETVSCQLEYTKSLRVNPIDGDTAPFPDPQMPPYSACFDGAARTIEWSFVDCSASHRGEVFYKNIATTDFENSTSATCLARLTDPKISARVAESSSESDGKGNTLLLCYVRFSSNQTSAQFE